MQRKEDFYTFYLISSKVQRHTLANRNSHSHYPSLTQTYTVVLEGKLHIRKYLISLILVTLPQKSLVQWYTTPSVFFTFKKSNSQNMWITFYNCTGPHSQFQSENPLAWAALFGRCVRKFFSRGCNISIPILLKCMYTYIKKVSFGIKQSLEHFCHSFISS